MLRNTVAVMAAPLLVVAMLIAAGSAGFSLGFDVWPLGEARNWIWILQQGDGSVPARVFWNIDWRNPLSPWWYIALRPAFLQVPWVFSALGVVVQIALGLSVFVLIRELTRDRSSGLALLFAMVTAAFVASIRHDFIHWNFVGAICCTLLTIWTFLRFDRDRANAVWFGLSLVFWFLAIGTYTIQTGGVVAVGLLSIVRHMERGGGAKKSLFLAGLDVLPYVLFLGLFILIWRTTGSGIAEQPLQFSPTSLLRSLLHGIWSDEQAALLWRAMQLPWPLAVAFFVVPGILASLVFRALVRSVDVSWPTALLVAAVAICIVAPTSFLEASSDTWTVGTRWVMVLPFWTPMLACIAVAMLSTAIPSKYRSTYFAVAVGFLVGAASLQAAGTNALQVAVSTDEKVFFRALEGVLTQDIADGAPLPRHYVIRNDDVGGYVPPEGFPGRSYSQTILGQVSYRYLHTKPSHNPSWGRVRFLEDGVYAAEWPDLGAKPYDNVGVLSWDGEAFTRLVGEAEEFVGLDVEWARSKPFP